MIGDGWSGESRRESTRARPDRVRRVCIVTGTRADYGLLRTVIKAVEAHRELDPLVVAAGAHLLGAGTISEVRRDVEIADIVPMQEPGKHTRLDDAQATGNGMARFARAFEWLEPDWVVVLGDRIEAFAAAGAASIGGLGVAHIHGGDRAEGVADESMRHAITKLAHLHLAATEASAERLRRLGERPEHVHVVGSPAVDELDEFEALDDERYQQLGAPSAVLLMHPIGRPNEQEEHAASAALGAIDGERVLALMPNHDPGRGGIVRAIQSSGVRCVEHLARPHFIGLLKRVALDGGVLVGNSSAALIEGAVLGVRCVDIGARQAGRERAANVVHAEERAESIAEALLAARRIDRGAMTHPYSDGGAGQRIAEHLARVDPHDTALLRKRCTY